MLKYNLISFEGNIALHMFTHETRERYDLESLWGIGAEFETMIDNNLDEDILVLEDLMSRKQNLLSDIVPLDDVANNNRGWNLELHFFLLYTF